MKRLSTSLLMAVVAAGCTASSSNATSTSSSSGGGALDGGNTMDASMAMPDAGRMAPQDPTLADLAAVWEEKVCRLYACHRRARDTAEVCALAQTASGWPWDTFRLALDSIISGRGTYNAQKGQACGAFLNALDFPADCTGPEAETFAELHGQAFRDSCGSLVTGTVAAEGLCDRQDECTDGGDCVTDRLPDCQGQCVVWLRAGDSCVGRFNDCAPQQFCDGTICKWRDLQPNGATCFDAATCRSGKCFDYVCRDQSPLDGECIQEGDCQPGLFCRPLPPSTGRLGICQVPAAEGAACGYTVRCAGNQPCEGYAWNAAGGWVEGTCAGVAADIGGACTPVPETHDFADTGCLADLVCNPVTSTCEAAPRVGEPCAMPGSLCGMDAYCDAQGTCRARKGDGEAATSAVECLGYFNSFEMTCNGPGTNACGF